MLGAQCKEQKDKRLIIENKKKLGEKDIYIENDLTWKERKNRDKAWDKAREFKEKGGKAKVVWLRKVRTNPTNPGVRRGQTTTETSRFQGAKVMNVAGTPKMKKEDWEYVKKFDIIGLVETWEEVNKGKWAEKQLKDYDLKTRYAIREKKTGKAKGGIILAIRRGTGIKVEWEEKTTEETIAARWE